MPLSQDQDEIHHRYGDPHKIEDDEDGEVTWYYFDPDDQSTPALIVVFDEGMLENVFAIENGELKVRYPSHVSGQGEAIRAAQDLMEQSLESRADGDLDARARLLGEAIQADPGYSDAYLALGWELMDVGDFPQAARILEKGLKADPPNLALRHPLALSLYHADRPDEAERAGERLLQMSPGSSWHAKIRELLAAIRGEALEEHDGPSQDEIDALLMGEDPSGSD